MTLRQYLAAMLIGAALAWTAIGIVLFRVSQPEASQSLIVFLYCALFIASLGTFAVGGFMARATLLRKKFKLETQVVVSFRQAFLLSMLVVLALFLSSQRQLNWWVGALMILGLSMIEAFLISLKMGKRAAEKKKKR